VWPGKQEFINPLQNGYTKDDDGIPKPHATDELPVPTAISEMVVCHCKGKCSTQSVAASHTTWLVLIMSVQQ